MDAVPIAEVMKALDLALIEWIPDRGYIPLSDTTPRWFTGGVPWGSLPFLEHFVDEAQRYLHDHLDGVIASDQFSVQGAGDELLLRARALKVNGRLVLAIERLIGAADVRPILRQAREQALDNEALTRKARAVHAPAAAVARAVEELQRVGVSTELEPVLDTLTRSVAALQEAVAALPAPPPRRRR